MKPTIASLVITLLFCGQGVLRKSLLGFAAPQGPHGPISGPPAGSPPGIGAGAQGDWWRDPEIAGKLHLSDEQVRNLDKLAQDHQLQDIDLRANVEKQDAVLHSEMESELPEEAQLFAQIDKVSQARTALEKSHMELMLAERHVLTTEQKQMLRDVRRQIGRLGPASRPDRGGPGGPPDGGAGRPPDGPPGPPPRGTANE